MFETGLWVYLVSTGTGSFFFLDELTLSPSNYIILLLPGGPSQVLMLVSFRDLPLALHLSIGEIVVDRRRKVWMEVTRKPSIRVCLKSLHIPIN